HLSLHLRLIPQNPFQRSLRRQHRRRLPCPLLVFLFFRPRLQPRLKPLHLSVEKRQRLRLFPFCPVRRPFLLPPELLQIPHQFVRPSIESAGQSLHRLLRQHPLRCHLAAHLTQPVPQNHTAQRRLLHRVNRIAQSRPLHPLQRRVDSP